MKFNKKSVFQKFIGRTLELRPIEQRHPYFLTRLERLLTICDRGRIAGVCCPNQIKNHHFVICRTLTSYLSLNFIMTYSHTEMQSPRGTSILFAVLVYFLWNYPGLHQTRTHLVPRILWCAASLA